MLDTWGFSDCFLDRFRFWFICIFLVVLLNLISAFFGLEFLILCWACFNRFISQSHYFALGFLLRSVVLRMYIAVGTEKYQAAKEVGKTKMSVRNIVNCQLMQVCQVNCLVNESWVQQVACWSFRPALYLPYSTRDLDLLDSFVLILLFFLI